MVWQENKVLSYVWKIFEKNKIIFWRSKEWKKEKVCKCEVCGQEKVCGFIGNNDNKPLYVCDECINKELETVYQEECLN